MSQSNLESDERHFIGNIVKKQTKYGSTFNNVLKEPRYIEHKLQPNDTLQGLALRYNVSMERIKRANNLWTTDSLFSRSSLNIPMDISIVSGDSSSSSSLSTTGLPPSNIYNANNGLYGGDRDGMSEIQCEDVYLEEEPFETTSTPPATSSAATVKSNGKLKRKDRKTKENLCDTSPISGDRPNGLNGIIGVGGGGDKREESVADFLIRIDSYIAKSKNQNHIMQERSSKLTNTYSDDDLFKSSRDKSLSSSVSYLRRQNSARNGIITFGDAGLHREVSNDVPQPLIMTHGRKVMSSLKRLEKQQDELFEL